MEFNKFLAKMRKTPEYDILLEAKEKQELALTSKEFIAIFYANDLWDQGYKMVQILKLFPKEYWKVVGETLRGRIKPEGICVAWKQAQTWIKIVEKYNEVYVDDKDYLERYYPCRVKI